MHGHSGQAPEKNRMVFIKSYRKISFSLNDVQDGPAPLREHRFSEKDLDGRFIIGDMPVVIVGRERHIHESEFRHVLVRRVVAGDTEDLLRDGS